MRIVFFGTPEIALPILAKLHQEHDIVAVITAPDAPVGRKQILTPSAVADWASEHRIITFKPAAVKSNPELVASLHGLDADIFIVVAYGKILPLEIIDLPRLKTLNIHFSLLPKYRGASPIQGALINGETETGTSIFMLEAGMDTGPILAQAKLVIDPDDDYHSLSNKLADLSAGLLSDLLPRYDQGEIQPHVQDNTQASYTKIITKADGQINWSNHAQEIYNQFRAYKHWPGIWTEWNNQKIKILNCKPAIAEDCDDPGTVKAQVICCGNQSGLQVIELQLEGGKPQSLQSFLNGHPDFKQAKLK